MIFKNTKNNNKNHKLIWQFIPCVLIYVLLVIVVTIYIINKNSKDIVLNDLKNDAIGVTNVLDNYIKSNVDVDWLIDFWVQNIDSIDICYDEESYNNKTTELLDAIKGDDADNIDDINDLLLSKGKIDNTEIKKLYAEYVYSSLIRQMDSLKVLFSPKYLYIATFDGIDEMTFVAAAALPTETRGENFDQIYTLGKKIKLDTSIFSDFIKFYNNPPKGQELFEYDWDIANDDEYYMYYPVFDSERNIKAAIFVSVDKKFIENAFFSNAARSIVIGMLVIVLGAMFVSFVMNQHIISPILGITNGVKNFAEDKNDTKLSDSMKLITSHNELGVLADGIADLGKNLVLYIDETTAMNLKQHKLDAELSLASRIQESALNLDFDIFPSNWNIDVFANMKPAKEVGGDFYNFFPIDDYRLAIFIADVSGKGIPAALFMMKCKVLIENDLKYVDDPVLLLEEVNNKICENNEAEMFVSVWVGIFDVRDGVLRSANAGHEYPIIKRADGHAEFVKDKHGLVVGAMNDISYKSHEVSLEHGDMIIVYTDGVTEATNNNNELYGEARLLECIENMDILSAKETMNKISDDINCFIHGAEQFDDLTMVIMRF